MKRITTFATNKSYEYYVKHKTYGNLPRYLEYLVSFSNIYSETGKYRFVKALFNAHKRKWVIRHKTRDKK